MVEVPNVVYGVTIENPGDGAAPDTKRIQLPPGSSQEVEVDESWAFQLVLSPDGTPRVGLASSKPLKVARMHLKPENGDPSQQSGDTFLVRVTDPSSGRVVTVRRLS